MDDYMCEMVDLKIFVIKILEKKGVFVRIWVCFYLFFLMLVFGVSFVICILFFYMYFLY